MQKLRPVSSVYGRIDEILLTYPNKEGALTKEKILKHYGGIFEAFGNRVKFVILASFADGEDTHHVKKLFEEALRESKAFSTKHVIHLEANYVPETKIRPHKMWAQDPYFILQDPFGEPVFLEPYYFPRKAEQLIAEQVSAYADYLMRAIRYDFEGGNLLAGDDYLLAGRDILEINLKKYYPKTKEGRRMGISQIETDLKRIFGVKYLYWVGEEQAINFKELVVRQNETECQPFFHLDLYLTLGGKDKEGKEIIYVAALQDPSNLQVLSKNTQKDFHQLKTMLDRTAAYFETVHTIAKGPGFFVRRLPMEAIIAEGVLRVHSYNNCLIECYGDTKNVYLPKYHDLGPRSQKTQFHCQEMARKAFSSSGYNVVFVDGRFKSLAKKAGSLHCIAKVLRRSFTSK